MLCAALMCNGIRSAQRARRPRAPAPVLGTGTAACRPAPRYPVQSRFAAGSACLVAFCASLPPLGCPALRSCPSRASSLLSGSRLPFLSRLAPSALPSFPAPSPLPLPPSLLSPAAALCLNRAQHFSAQWLTAAATAQARPRASRSRPRAQHGEPAVTMLNGQRAQHGAPAAASSTPCPRHFLAQAALASEDPGPGVATPRGLLSRCIPPSLTSCPDATAPPSARTRLAAPLHWTLIGSPRRQPGPARTMTRDLAIRLKGGEKQERAWLSKQAPSPKGPLMTVYPRPRCGGIRGPAAIHRAEVCSS
jgi:hypothetical protein